VRAVANVIAILLPLGVGRHRVVAGAMALDTRAELREREAG